MKLPIPVAEKLILLQNGDKIPFSKMKHEIIQEMLGNGILKKQIRGRSKILIYLSEQKPLTDFLQNHYGIADLHNYIKTLTNNDLTRAESIAASSDSKIKSVRTFKGFLVNCYSPIPAILNEKPTTVNPIVGTFQFIYDFETFTIPQDITVVGIENPENFRHVDGQKYLFENIKPLFVSRYPQNQSKDLIKWLQSIPNEYLHFGDFDFAGIGIYLNEYKKYLADKATFFIPDDIEKVIAQYGNRSRYNDQKINFDTKSIKDDNLLELIRIIHKHKKGLDQEIFIKKQ